MFSFEIICVSGFSYLCNYIEFYDDFLFCIIYYKDGSKESFEVDLKDVVSILNLSNSYYLHVDQDLDCLDIDGSDHVRGLICANEI